MNRLSKTEYLVLKALYLRDFAGDPGLALTVSELGLKEKDAINRIRELVYYIERLEKEGFVETDSDFYIESDHMSFEYLNSAVELKEDRVRLSSQGTELMAGMDGGTGAGGLGSGMTAILEMPQIKSAVTVLVIVAMGIGGLIGFLVGRMIP